MDQQGNLHLEIKQTSTNYWDTLGSDISTNNIFGNNGNFLGDMNIAGKLTVAGFN